MSHDYRARRGALMAAGVAALSAFAMSAAPAEAQYYRHRGYAPGAAIGLGVAGGLLAGAVIAGAARPAPVIVDEPAYERECWYERRRVWDGYGYVRERVRVCD